MKTVFKSILVILAVTVQGMGCKKSNDTKTKSASPIVGFWTYKEDAAVDYWNQNILFKSDGTFRAYTALSLTDTSAARALADTANQVVTFGTYTVKGVNVELDYTEFAIVGLKLVGSLNAANNILIGNLESSDTTAATPLFYLTKP